jgi:hypothetical protein
MMSAIEILREVYREETWHARELNLGGAGCCTFCLAAEDRAGAIHHFAGCLLRQIRTYLMAQTCGPRRMLEALAQYDHEYPDYGSGGLSWLSEPLPDAQCPTDPAPAERHPTPAELDEVPLPAEYDGRGKTQGPELIEVTAAPVAPAAVKAGGASQPGESPLSSSPPAEVAPKVQLEFDHIHRWQAVGSGKAVRCANCGLIVLDGRIPAMSRCSGVVGTVPATDKPVTALEPAIPLVQVVCPRCHACETVPATGGVLPDLPQITLTGGPFMVVKWVHPAHGQQAGVYCINCWSDSIAAMITGVVPCAVVLSAHSDSGPKQPA